MPSRSSARSSAITTRTGPPRTGPWGRRPGEAMASVPSSAARRLCRPSSPWPVGVGAAAAVVAHLDAQAPVLAPHAHLGAARPRVLDGVGQRLGDGEVGGELDRRRAGARRGRPRRWSAAACAPRARRSPRPGRARTAAPGGCRARGRAARPAPARASPRAFVDELARALGVAVEALLGHAEVERERDEPRLRAVVQVALDALQLGGGGVDRAGARLGQDLDALLELPAARGRARPASSAPLAAAVPRTSAAATGSRTMPMRHGQERVAPRVDLEEAEVLRVGSRAAPTTRPASMSSPSACRPRRHGDREVRDADREQQQVPGEVLPRRRVREERLEAVQEAAVDGVGRRRGSARRARAPRGGARSRPSSARRGW